MENVPYPAQDTRIKWPKTGPPPADECAPAVCTLRSGTDARIRYVICMDGAVLEDGHEVNRPFKNRHDQKHDQDQQKHGE